MKDDDKEGVIKPAKSKPRAKVIIPDSDIEMEQPQEKMKAKGKAKVKETIDIQDDGGNDFISPKHVAGKSRLEAKRKRYVEVVWSLNLQVSYFCSPDTKEDNSPATKKTKMNLTSWLTTEAPTVVARTMGADTQRKVSRSMKPASPKVKEKRAAATKKQVVKSDDEGDGDSDFEDLSKPPPRKAAPARKAAVSRSKYIELSSEDEREDDSIFVDDDD